METYHDKTMPQGQVIDFRDRPHELPEEADLQTQEGKRSIVITRNPPIQFINRRISISRLLVYKLFYITPAVYLM